MESFLFVGRIVDFGDHFYAVKGDMSFFSGNIFACLHHSISSSLKAISEKSRLKQLR
jgi:hypothetical protein